MDLPLNFEAWEVDTSKIYLWNGLSWTPKVTESAYSYVIFKDKSITYGQNSTGKILTYDTDSRNVFRSINALMRKNGAGTTFIRNGEYIFPNSGLPIDDLDGTYWIGESREETILRNQHSDYEIFRWRRAAGTPPPTWGLRNMTLQSETIPSVMYLGGSKDCLFENCRFRRTISPLQSSFITFFDDVSKTRRHDRMHMHNCIYEGSTSGQDMFGSGELYGCDISHNSFLKGDGQGIAVNRASNCSFSDNYFYNIGNPIGLENVCELNIINNNRVESCSGYIKLSSNIPGELSRGNACCFNRICYGSSGIRDYAGRDDIIEGNLIFRTKQKGIFGAFDRCVIVNNQLLETNYARSMLDRVVRDGSNYLDGGIVLGNNPNFPMQDMNKICGNTIRSGLPPFTIPTGYLDGGTSRTGFAGGIITDTDVTNAEIHDNNLWHTHDKLVKLGRGGSVSNNLGYLTENENATTIADGDSVSHGLVTAPGRVFTTTTIAGEHASVTALDTKMFTVAIKKTDGTAGSTQRVYWRAVV